MKILWKYCRRSTSALIIIATPFFQAKEPPKNQLPKTGLGEEFYIIREYTPRAGAPKSEKNPKSIKIAVIVGPPIDVLLHLVG